MASTATTTATKVRCSLSQPRSVHPGEDAPVSVLRRGAASIYRNNASKILPVSIDASSMNFKGQIRKVIATFCDLERADWLATGSEEDDDDDADFSVAPLSGGLSNELFVATHRQDCFLVRLHPDSIPPEASGHDRKASDSPPSPPSLVDREQETRLLAWLADRHLAPTLFGRFANGRIEEFYRAHAPLTFRELPRYTPQVAALLGQLHAQTVPESILPACVGPLGHVGRQIDRWCAMARRLGRHRPLLDELEAEWKWLQGAWTQAYGDPNDCGTVSHQSTRRVAIEFGREVVVCHMDAQSLNFLKPTGPDGANAGDGANAVDGALKMIDYEYSGRNPRVLDIANTFCEFSDMSHMNANFATDYPSRATQDAFLRSYLSAVRHGGSPVPDMDTEEEETFRETLRTMIARSTVVSHLMWSVWSVVQDSLAHIAFDYEAYARHRLDGYRYGKSAYWKS